MQRQIIGSIPVLIRALVFSRRCSPRLRHVRPRTPARQPALRIFPAFGCSTAAMFSTFPAMQPPCSLGPGRSSSPRGNGDGPNVAISFAENTDPFIKNCDPLGVPRVLLANHPFKIIPAAGEIRLKPQLREEPRFSRYDMDGRQHPKDLDPSWWGNSIEHRDGDSLASETRLV